MPRGRVKYNDTSSAGLTFIPNVQAQSFQRKLNPRVAMWLRNLVFFGICLTGAAILADSLLRRPVGDSPHPKAAATEPVADWQPAVEELNRQFRDRWHNEGLTPAPAADDLTVARRLALSLVGTVPSLEEIRGLETIRPEERQTWWLDHLLRDRRFADYWAERLARIYVGHERGPFLLFRRRRFSLWLSEQLHTNAPYDATVRQLIAEDGIWTGKPAANFVTVTAAEDNENQPDPVRLAGRTARAFLGMRIDCLQCHDDKLGNVLVGNAEEIHSGTQATFHQLAAFFGDTQISLLGVRDGDQPYEYKYLKADRSVIVPPLVPFGDDFVDGHGQRREQLARWVTHPKNKPFARATVNRVWALLFGKPLVSPVDDIPLRGPFPPGLEHLADDFVKHGFDLARLIRVIAASEAFSRDSQADFELSEEHEANWAAFPVTRLRPEQMAGSVVQASSLTTIDGQTHVLLQIAKYGQTQDFVQRYGDLGEDEFNDQPTTIPQRLLMMNGKLVKERTNPNPLNSASTRIAMLNGKPETQVEAAYLAVLTRRPTDDELNHFVGRLKNIRNRDKAQVMEDLFWTLVNSTEFSWNH